MKHLVVIPVAFDAHLMAFDVASISSSVVVKALFAILAHMWKKIDHCLTDGQRIVVFLEIKNGMQMVNLTI